MATRLELDEKLRLIAEHVYFQPPETRKIVYPCIIYNLERDNATFADDMVYRRGKRYSVTVIDRNPDSELPDRLADAFGIQLERHYTADNLHHFSYTVNC